VEFVTSLPDKSMDRIFALDCAYHFSSRRKFLDESKRVLRNDGMIVMTDLIFGENMTTFQRLLMRVVCVLTGAPYSNFKMKEQYHSDFVEAGFERISIEDISENVFPRLRDFIFCHHKEMEMFEISGKWTGYLIFARILKWWWESDVVRFILVSASNSLQKDI
jgi:SAM-dependent methyltransferase